MILLQPDASACCCHSAVRQDKPGEEPEMRLDRFWIVGRSSNTL